MSNKPIAKWGKGIRVTAWKTDKGSTSYSLEKQYKDKETNTWKSTRVWFLTDLEELIRLLQEAVKFGRDEKAQENEWKRPAKSDDWEAI